MAGDLLTSGQNPPPPASFRVNSFEFLLFARGYYGIIEFSQLIVNEPCKMKEVGELAQNVIEIFNTHLLAFNMLIWLSMRHKFCNCVTHFINDLLMNSKFFLLIATSSGVGRLLVLVTMTFLIAKS